MAIGDDGFIYEQRGGALVSLNDSGTIRARYPLPIPLPGTPTLDGKPTKEVIPQNAARLGAVIASGGHIYVFVDNVVNAVVADLSTGRRVELPEVGFVTAGAMGTDGYLYASMIDPSRTTNSYRIGRFDPGTLALSRSWDTPIRLADGQIDSPPVELSASPRGEIWFLGSQNRVGTHTSHLLRLDTNTLTLSEIVSPTNAGSRLQIGVDGNPYVFGGPARNAVYSTDTGRAALVKVTEAGGPDGSSVLAVFPR
jgi:hypothetical protein